MFSLIIVASVMKDNEHILDSGEIYKDFEPLELPLGDEESLKIDWGDVALGTRVKPGGDPLKTHYLIGRKEVRWFVPALSIFLFIGFTLFSGLLTLIVIVLYLLFYSWSWSALLVLLPLAAFGIYSLSASVRVIKKHSIIVLDKRIGLYKKGKKESYQLENIKAIQLIKEYVKRDLKRNETLSQKEEFFSYELNLILKDGTRINVVDHSNEKVVIRQAVQLGRFLEVPILKRKH